MWSSVCSIFSRNLLTQKVIQNFRTGKFSCGFAFGFFFLVFWGWRGRGALVLVFFFPPDINLALDL